MKKPEAASAQERLAERGVDTNISPEALAPALELDQQIRNTYAHA
jgi:hypothetical protein